MAKTNTATFKIELLLPAKPAKAAKDESWAFFVLPKTASDKLPRRGRATADCTVNGYAFQATLDPDGQLGHWLKISQALCEAAHVKAGDMVDVQITPAAQEPEPKLPVDLQQALAQSPAARAVWDNTTTIARLDWIHWIESAKLAKTRESRVKNGCDMLASGKKRVCCFDQSGHFSKSLSAPQPAE